MLRYGFILAVLLMVCLPVVLQETMTMLPYAYVLETETGYDSFVMDVRSWEILYEIAESCPQTMSPNRQWLAYSQLPNYELFVLDIITGNLLPIADKGTIREWSADSTRFTYQMYADGETSTYIYDLTTESSALVYTSSIFGMRFVGNSLFFISLENDLIQLHRWNEESEIIASFEQAEADERMSLSEISMSPNRQFIALSYQDLNRIYAPPSSYLINVATGVGEVFQEYDAVSAVWRPQSPATFAYSNGGLIFVYDAVTKDVIVLDNYGEVLSWSADGKYFLARNDLADTTEIRLVEVAGDVIELWVYQGYIAFYSEWVSSSQFVSHHTAAEEHWQHEIFLYDVDTGERQLTDTAEIHEMTGCPQG